MWDETINHIISEYSKLPQKEYESRHDWVDKVIHLELRKKLKFDQIVCTQAESTLKNEAQSYCGFLDTNGVLIPIQKTRLSEN